MSEGTEHAGLADRLRTCVSAYIIANENNRKLYIYHDKGFRLEKYLEPNNIDWRIRPEEICWGLNKVSFLWFCHTLPVLRHPKKEYHAYALLAVHLHLPEQLREKYTYHSVFWHIFRASDHLTMLIEQALQHAKLKKNQFIAIHLRFLNFFEPVEPGTSISDVTGTPEQQTCMVSKVHEIIKRLHFESGGLDVLLFSDSNTFLQLPHPCYVKTLPGTVGHVAKSGCAEEQIDKTFTDLFVMAQARAIFRIAGPHLYNSGFSPAAADIGGKPISVVQLPS